MAKSSKLVAFTVFYGGEEYLLDREFQRGRTWPGRMVTVLDGAEASDLEVLSALDQTTLDGTEIAVVLDNAQQLKLTAAFKAYVEARNPSDTYSVLVAIHRSATLVKGWQAFSEKCRVIEHKKFKPWETDLIQKRMAKEADRLGLRFQDGAFDMLLRIYKEDIRGMVNEIQKLAFIVPVGGDITKQHILDVCRKQLAVQPWEIADLASNKSLKQALTYTALLFKYEDEGVAVPIVMSLMRQTERLLIARTLLDQGKGKDVICTALGMGEYHFEKRFLPVVKKHQASVLLNQMKNLCKLETQVKGQAQSKRTLVELAVHQLAA